MIKTTKRAKAEQYLAHLLCEAAHPREQATMTGFLFPDGEFIVSCATHKIKAATVIAGAEIKEKMIYGND